MNIPEQSEDAAIVIIMGIMLLVSYVEALRFLAEILEWLRR